MEGIPDTRQNLEDAAMPLARPALIALALAVALGAAGCGDGPQSPAPIATPAGVQPAGIYKYATEGSERIGGPLPGSHRYGPTSTIRVDVADCDLTERWEAIPERSAEWRYCVTGKTWRLESVTDYHEFFGQVERNAYRCSGRRVPRPAQIEEGFRWTDRCRARRISAVARGEVVSIGPLAAAGAQVDAVHLRVSTVLSGRATGAYVLDSWLRRSDGLLLRRTFESDTRVRSAVGIVPARERYTLRIRSLKPR
jgi:hypothetical protein